MGVAARGSSSSSIGQAGLTRHPVLEVVLGRFCELRRRRRRRSGGGKERGWTEP